jgi:hypothetical protein
MARLASHHWRTSSPTPCTCDVTGEIGMTQANLFAFPADEKLELHSHHFVEGMRSARTGNWPDGTGPNFTHSHPGGSSPHRHPATGPSNYGYRQPKVTKKPTGEQYDLIPITDEDELSFDLIITDSAKFGGTIPIGDTPIEELGMPAAERMMAAFRLKCNVIDERKKRRA